MIASGSPERRTVKLEKRIQIALPVKVSGWAEGGKTLSQMACTYDLSQNGARLVGVNVVNQPGDVVVLERGKTKALYRVMWVGKPGTPLEGQMGVSCIEPDRMVWEVNLQELEEQYEPILMGSEEALRYPAGGMPERQDIKAKVGVYPENGGRGVQGTLLMLSYVTCELLCHETLASEVPVNVLVVTDEVDVRLHGVVERMEGRERMVIALDEVRRGDRRKLKYLLQPQGQSRPARMGD